VTTDVVDLRLMFGVLAVVVGLTGWASPRWRRRTGRLGHALTGGLAIGGIVVIAVVLSGPVGDPTAAAPVGRMVPIGHDGVTARRSGDGITITSNGWKPGTVVIAMACRASRAPGSAMTTERLRAWVEATCATTSGAEARADQDGTAAGTIHLADDDATCATGCVVLVVDPATVSAVKVAPLSE
jgi:hypothetical protein